MPIRDTPRLSVRRRRRALVACTAVLPVAMLAFAAASHATTVIPGAGAAPRVSARTEPGCGPQLYKPDGTPWTCTFADDFSGTAVDPSKWLVASTAATGFSAGRSCLVPQNVTEHDGVLDLKAADLGRTFWCRAGRTGFSTRYTGGHLATNGRFSQTYGRFEVRARYPGGGRGLHAGFWMYPATMIYGAWPASGEIDVAEWWSVAPHTIVPTLHYRGSTAAADSTRSCTVADATAWHTYQVLWLPQRITFGIDGHACFSRTWRPRLPQLAPQPFNRPFVMDLTNVVDANDPWNRVTAATVLPSSYQVDYARAWK